MQSTILDTPEIEDINFDYAGFWWRFLAAIIDGIIMRLVGFIVGLLTSIDINMTGFGLNQSNWSFTDIWLSAASGYVVQWLYFAIMESSSYQATLGKKMLGLTVSDEEGNRISFGRATGRFFGKILSVLVLLIGFIMAAFTKKKQALHDIMARTIVVKKAEGSY